MPFSIVFDAPEPQVARRILRSGTTLLGSVMVLCGILLASPILPIGLLAAAASGQPAFPFDPGVIQALAAALEGLGTDDPAAATVSRDQLIVIVLASAAWVAVSVILIVVGFRLLRRHRALVLFLRRFGHHHATTAVTHAVATTIGSGWRLVTLDDGGIAPMGVRGSLKAMIGAARRALLLTRLPRISAEVLTLLAPLLLVVFAWDVLQTVFWRNGTFDPGQTAVAWRQIQATARLAPEVLARETGVSPVLIVAAAGAILAGAVALRIVRLRARWMAPRPQPRSQAQSGWGGPLRSLLRRCLARARGAPLVLAMVASAYLAIEVSRSVSGLEGALSAEAWLRVGGPYLDVLTDILDGRLPVARVGLRPDGVFALLAFAGALVALAGIGSLLVLAGGAVLLAPVWFFMSATHTAMARAERNRIAIRSERDLKRAAADVRVAAGYALAPRLTVLEVWSGIWQLAVRDFLQISSVSLIDVSDPTENVLWELELIATSGMPCVAIGEHGALAAVAVTAGGAPSPASPADRLVHLLDGQHVLAYTTDPAGMTRFARALRSRLLEASLAAR